MAINKTDNILSLSSSPCPSTSPAQDCTAWHGKSLLCHQGFVFNTFCLIIIRMMKTFIDVFLVLTNLVAIHKSWLRHALPVSKHVPLNPRLTIKLSQWHLEGSKCSCKCFWISVHLILPCKLPYNKLIRWLYGAACLVFHSQDTFSVWRALFVSSNFQHPPLEKSIVQTYLKVPGLL